MQYLCLWKFTKVLMYSTSNIGVCVRVYQYEISCQISDCDCICCVFDFKNNEVQTNKALFHGLRRNLSLCYYHKGFLTAVYIYTLLNLNRPLHIIYEDVT